MVYDCPGCNKPITKNDSVTMILGETPVYLHRNTNVRPDGGFSYPDWCEEKSNPLSCIVKYTEKGNRVGVTFGLPPGSDLEEITKDTKKAFVRIALSEKI